MMKSLKIAAVAALVATPMAGFAHHDGEVSGLDDVVVSHAWTEETGEMSHGVDVFLTIQNDGDAPVRLVAASTDFTDSGVFQAPVVGPDGALVVREVPAVEIGPGQTLTFQPGGIHIALPNVQRALEGGEHFHLSLEFEEAGAVEVEVEVDHHDAEGEHDHDHEEPAS